MRQLDGIDAARREWELKDKRMQLIARAIPAIAPFLEFPTLVHEHVTGLIETLDQGTRAWLEKLYRPHYLGGPGYSGFDAMQETGVGLRAGMGEICIPAHHVMNASLLRACVWAFLFSLWEHVHRHAGGLDCLLLDDPQTHFDPINSENLAAAIPVMPERGMRPVVATTRFMAAIQSALPRQSAGTLPGPRLSLIRSRRPDSRLQQARRSMKSAIVAIGGGRMRTIGRKHRTSLVKSGLM